MYRFALCEDEQVSLEYLGERIEQEFTRRMGKGDRREPGFKLDRYGRAEELLEAASRGIRYDVMFLDIVMPEIDGFEICRRLRTWEKETLIVFVSANEELVFQSFDVQPFAFLRKNHIWSDLEMVAGKLLHRLSQSDAEQIAIQEEQSGKVHMLSVQTTIYVEAQIHQCRVRTVNGEFFMRCRFRDVEQALSSCGFVKVHRSYLVNYRHVSRIENQTVLLSEGTRLALSRGRAADVKKEILLWNRR